MTKDEYIDGMKNAEDRYEYYVNFDNIMAIDDNINLLELANIGKEYLSDSEKVKFLLSRPFSFDKEKPYKDNCFYRELYKSIKDINIKNELVFNSKFIDKFGNYDLIDLMPKESIVILLHNPDKRLMFNNFSNYDYISLISKLDDSEKMEFLEDFENFECFEFKSFDIANILLTIKSDELINKALNLKFINKDNIVDILVLLEDKFIINSLQVDDDRICKDGVEKLIRALRNVDNIIDVFNNIPEVLEKNGLDIQVISSFWIDKNKQIELLSRIDEINRSYQEKRRAFVNLTKDVRESLNEKEINTDYKKVINLDYDDNNIFGSKLIFNPQRNAEEYRGLDKFLKIMPKNFSKYEREKLYELFEICPNVGIYSDMNEVQTAKEYRNGENWIDSVINKIDTEMTDIQKIYIVDEAIGKRISYSPIYKKVNQDTVKVRQLWSIIDTGYGVCNGIAEVENYILNKIGIENEIVSSKTHSFLKIKNLNVDGENVGNSILDPTWNLSENRVSDRPEWFLISYENAKMKDGSDAHQNDENLEDAVFNLDKEKMEKELCNIGKVNSEGKFPFEDKLLELDEFYDKCDNPNEIILKCLKFAQDYIPDFVNCQNSTKSILVNILSRIILKESKKLKVREGSKIVNVYRKDDKNKEAVNLIQIVKEDGVQFFAYSDKETNSFKIISERNLEKNFASYDVDKEQNNGMELWDLTVNLDSSNREGENKNNDKDMDE